MRFSGPGPREAAAGYAFISPWLLGFVVFAAGPLLASLALSFTNWDLLGTPAFVGTANYTRLVHDELFWDSLRVTGIYALGRVPLGIVVGVLVALLLNQRVRLLGFWRVLYYLPVVLPPVAVSLAWSWIYNPEYGLLNGFLKSAFGLTGPEWLRSEVLVLPSLIVVGLWASAGRSMILYLAGFNSISRELHEAAEVDGAGSIRRFLTITLPLLTPTIFFNLVIGLIDAFKVFTQPYVMTGGGPNHASLMYVFYLYQNAFSRFQMGYASALAWVFFVVVMALTLIVFRGARSWVYYESAGRGVI
jgi:multiple sugar transport system permease protein